MIIKSWFIELIGELYIINKWAGLVHAFSRYKNALYFMFLLLNLDLRLRLLKVGYSNLKIEHSIIMSAA